MVNYQNGKIYKIVCNETGKIYIGSTTKKTLAMRLAQHVCNYKSFLSGGSNFTTSFDIIKNNNYDIILIELCPCNTKDELHQKERYFIENNECVNKVIPLRTQKEWAKSNYEENKNEIIEKNKEHYHNNKEKYILYRSQNKEQLKARNKAYDEKRKEKMCEKHECFCGGKYTTKNKIHHFKTKMHKYFLDNNINEQ
jgi:hypothetical protein